MTATSQEHQRQDSAAEKTSFDHVSLAEKQEEKIAVSAVELQYTKEEEKKLLRKLDWNVVSFVCALYCVSYLDRGNIGNANTAGMSKSLGFEDDKYQWLLTIFYISYICSQPMSLCWKKFPPRYYVPCVVFGWGLISTVQAAAQNWSGMMALRFLLGIFEAGFVGVPYYLTFFYHRTEVAFRTGLFISVSPLSSAFAGALAYGITSNPNLAIENWRVLFLVEALPTVALAFVALYAVPSNIDECRFLTDREKDIGRARTAKQVGTVQRDHKLGLKEVFKGVFSVQSLMPALMFFSINVSFSSLPVFMPTILDNMGFSSVRAQGLSAPPYVVTCLMVILASWFSDKIKNRGFVICGISCVGAAGYLIMALCNNTGVKYFALYLVSAGVFPCVALLISWTNNNQKSDASRGGGFVILQVFGQCGPLLGTRLYPDSDAPRFEKGFFVGFGFMCLVAVCSFALSFYLRWENKKLDQKYGPAEGNPTNPEDALGMEGEDNPHFRYIE